MMKIDQARPLCFSKAWNHTHEADVSPASFWCLKTSTPPAPSNEESPVVAAASLSQSAF